MCYIIEDNRKETPSMIKQYTQLEILNLIETYNTTDRKQITENLHAIKKEYQFQNADIIEDFGYSEIKVKQWFNKTSPNIPTIEDALRLACTYGFEVTELIEGVKYYEKIIYI